MTRTGERRFPLLVVPSSRPVPPGAYPRFAFAGRRVENHAEGSMTIERSPAVDPVTDLLREFTRQDISRDRRGAAFTKLRARCLSMLRAELAERYARLSDQELCGLKAMEKNSQLPYHVYALRFELKKRAALEGEAGKGEGPSEGETPQQG
jgi:hypothetical protein